MKGRLNLRPLAVFAASAALAVSAFAQNIGVVINGNPVRFAGVGPQSMRGRVLVPLRGVLEQMGAYVGYEAATSTVHASRGDIDIQLRIGSNQAQVNGQQITLDVPAMIYRGSTLVPLRFMGQALGATVRWENATQTVHIATADAGTGGGGTGTGGTGTGGTGTGGTGTGGTGTGGTTPPATGGGITITSFTSDAPGYLRGGSTVTFTLRGTPGGAATLQIPRVTGEIPLRETNPGVYTATFTVPNNPANPITVREGSAIARLRVGNAEQLIQAGNPISIDTQPPVIRSTTPAQDARVARSQPLITGEFDDAGGSGVDPQSVRITLDGREVAPEATTSSSFYYRPQTALTPGRHTLSIAIRDQAGNTATRAYEFTVAETEAIRSFTHTGVNAAAPGDVLRFVLLGEAGGTATFSIGNEVTNVAMREEEPGRYVGEYTVRRGDDFQGDVVTARLRTKTGEVFTTESGQPVGVKSGPAGAPTISAPTEGTRIGSNNFTVRGRTAPRARVRIRVSYNSPIFGIFERTGKLYDQVVEADANGNFETGAIDPNFLGADRNTTYTITATTIGANDTESEATTLTLKR